jgi:ClpP class serine protease
MAHELHKLASTIWNKPHLISPDAFNVILDYIDARNRGINLMLPTSDPDNDMGQDTDDDDDLGVAVINIDGSLTYKPVVTMCGEVGTSYESLREDVEEALEAGYSTIVLNVSSGGGESSHCFETAEDIRAMCDQADANLIAYVDTHAYSAAYALIVIADEVIVNPSASVGSIGAVVALMDTSKAMEQQGLKRIFISAGDQKVPFDDDGSFKQDFLDKIQQEVNVLNSQFIDFVSKYSHIDAKVIRDFQAGVFNAQDAVANGLANKIMTNKEFATYIASLQGASNA